MAAKNYVTSERHLRAMCCNRYRARVLTTTIAFVLLSGFAVARGTGEARTVDIDGFWIVPIDHVTFLKPLGNGLEARIISLEDGRNYIWNRGTSSIERPTSQPMAQARPGHGAMPISGGDVLDFGKPGTAYLSADGTITWKLTEDGQIEITTPETKSTLPIKSRIHGVIKVPGEQHLLIAASHRSGTQGASPNLNRDIYIARTDGAVLNNGEPIIENIKGPNYIIDHSQIWLCSLHHGAWTPICYLVGTKNYLKSATLRLNGHTLTFIDKQTPTNDDSGPYLAINSPILRSATLDLKFYQEVKRDNISAQLILVDKESGTVATSGSRAVNGKIDFPLNWQSSLDHPYVVTLQIQDSFGTQFYVSWKDVHFTMPWWTRRWFRTFAASVAITVVGIALLALLPLKLSYKRWIPFACMALSGWGGFSEWADKMNVDGPGLAAFLIAISLVAVPAGLISPGVFRTLAEAAPLNLLVPFGLALPWVRRRLFLEYVKSCEERLVRVRREANFEVYVPIPAKIDSHGGLVANPAEAILHLVTSQVNESCTVLVESAGGAGKSALLREVLELALSRFRDTAVRLPVWCEPRGESVFYMARTALSRHLISDAALDAQLRSGQILLFIDGLSESSVDPEVVRNFVTSEYGHSTSLFVTSRPNQDIHRTMQSANHSVIVEPQRLDEQTYNTFEEAYIESDAERGDATASRLPEEVKYVCRARDGTYLPILVRFAMLVGEREIDSVAQIYELTFRRLLRRKTDSKESDLLDQASELCRDTYWKTGQRTLIYAGASREREQLLEKLLHAGILVPTRVFSRHLTEPREVRFFHDSMQSYLTARSLAHDQASWKSRLAEAAGSPRFLAGDTTAPNGGGSELFQMCLHVFGPLQLLRQALQDDLYRWAEEHEEVLRKKDIRDALPTGLQERLAQETSPKTSPGDALRAAVRVCMEGDEEKTVSNLGSLYGRLAPIVFKSAENRATGTNQQTEGI